MLDLDIPNVEVFEHWLDEEREYLQGLKTEPVAETLHMEYYQKLVNYHASMWVSAYIILSRLWPQAGLH